MNDLLPGILARLQALGLGAEDGGIGGLLLAIIVVIVIIIAAIIAWLVPGD